MVALPFLVTSGWALWGARLASWLATVGAGAVGAWVVRRAGGSWAAVVFTLGSMAAFYAPTAHWYDLARVDAVETFFVVAGVAALAAPDGRPGTGHLWLAAALLVAAVLTKQTAGLFCVAALVHLGVARDWRRLATLATAFAVLGLGCVVALWFWSDGWIVQIYTIPRHHMTTPEGFWIFVDFAIGLVPFLALGAVGVRGPAGRVFLVHAAAALVIAGISATKVGGEPNSALPAIFLTAVSAGLGAVEAWQLLEGSVVRRALRAAATALLAVWPLWTGAIPPDALAWIPSFEDRWAARELWADMRREPGEFLAYNYSFASTVLRGHTYAVGDRLFDFAGGYDDATFRQPVLARYPPEFVEAIRERRYSAIYTNGFGIVGDPIELIIRQHYMPALTFGTPSNAPGTLRWRLPTPRVKWVPRPG